MRGQLPQGCYVDAEAFGIERERLFRRLWGRSDQAFEKSFVVHVARFRRHIHDRFRFFGPSDARFESGFRTFRCC